MASSSQFMVSSSPTPHQLHSFRRFAPQPSPLAHTSTLFRRQMMGTEPSLDLDEQECLEDDEEELDEEDLDDDDDDEQKDDDEEDEFDDEAVHPDQQGPTSPPLDVSFASSMSFGTAPPTPSLTLRRPTVASQRLTCHPTPPSHRHHHVSQPVASTSTFLPAHLFAPNPDAMPPSSSPYRMDISPPPVSRMPPPTLAAQFFNPPKASSSRADPFATHASSSHVLSSSPPTDRPTIGLKKNKSRARMGNGFFEPQQPSQPPPTSDEESDRMGSDGMDIDSPGYSQQPHSIFQPLVVVNDSHSPVRRPPRSGRSGSQGSIGKRSRSDEDEYDDDLHSGGSSLGSDMRSVQMHPRTRSDEGLSSGRLLPLSPARSHSGSGRTRTMPETAGHLIVAESSRGLQLPSSPLGPGPSSSHFGHRLDPGLSSSPSQMMSPSVKAAAKMTLGRKAGERSLSGFRFPVTKASTGPQIPHVRAGSSGSNASSRHQLACAGGSLGASTLSGVPKRPGLGVVQSAATLFSRHQHHTLPVVPMYPTDADAPGTRQRDAAGRPASKSRRAISFAATEGHLLMSGAGDEDEEDEEEDGLAGFNCSPAPRGTNHTWPKYNSSFAHSRIASETVVNGVAGPIRKRSPPPPALLSVAASSARTPFENLLQSPNRLSPHQMNMMMGSRTIESPVGMGFSEKERAGKILPCHKVSNDGLMRISPATMDDLLEGRYDQAISKKIVIDCRFRYEYEGGHIRQAINFREKELVEQMLLGGQMFEGTWTVPEPSESGKCDLSGQSKKVVLVFHCEYSAMRAPTIAKYLREKDRHLNMPHYPALHYPEVYILEGGYARYHAHSPQHCDGSYVPMDDPSHRIDRHMDLNQFRNKEFSRAKSFTYGEPGPVVKKKTSTKPKKVVRDENSAMIMEEEEEGGVGESPCMRQTLEKRRSNQCLRSSDLRRSEAEECARLGGGGGGSLGRTGSGPLMMRKLEPNTNFLRPMKR